MTRTLKNIRHERPCPAHARARPPQPARAVAAYPSPISISISPSIPISLPPPCLATRTLRIWPGESEGAPAGLGPPVLSGVGRRLGHGDGGGLRACARRAALSRRGPVFFRLVQVVGVELWAGSEVIKPFSRTIKFGVDDLLGSCNLGPGARRPVVTVTVGCAAPRSFP